MADQKLSELTELAATPASDDEVYIRDVSEEVALESKRITIANLMAAAAGAVSSSGTYTGDATNNRAIAHGLGVAPKIVLIATRASTTVRFLRIHSGLAEILGHSITAATSYGATYPACTAMDATNFYVGSTSPGVGGSGNVNAQAYFWVALG